MRTVPSLSGGDLGAVPAAVACNESVRPGGPPPAGFVECHGSDDPPSLLHPVGTGEQALVPVERAVEQASVGLLARPFPALVIPGGVADATRSSLGLQASTGRYADQSRGCKCREWNVRFASRSMERYSTSSRDGIIPASTTTNGPLGPNSGYGFFSASSDGRPSTMADHEEAIRNFVSQVDPNTGSME